MAKQGKARELTQKSITPDRAARLYRMLVLVAEAPKKREALLRRLRLDIRGFYRDLELLRTAGIPLLLRDGYYELQSALRVASDKLPFPDPNLTIGEARQLVRGRTSLHQKLKEQLTYIVGKKR